VTTTTTTTTTRTDESYRLQAGYRQFRVIRMRKKVSALDLVVCTLLLSFVLIYIRTLTLTLPDLQFGNSVQFSVRVQLLKKKKARAKSSLWCKLRQ